MNNDVSNGYPEMRILPENMYEAINGLKDINSLADDIYYIFNSLSWNSAYLDKYYRNQYYSYESQIRKILAELVGFHGRLLTLKDEFCRINPSFSDAYDYLCELEEFNIELENFAIINGYDSLVGLSNEEYYALLDKFYEKQYQELKNSAEGLRDRISDAKYFLDVDIELIRAQYGDEFADKVAADIKKIDVLETQLVDLEADISYLEMIKYNTSQKVKESKYLDIMETTEYKNFLSFEDYFSARTTMAQSYFGTGTSFGFVSTSDGSLVNCIEITGKKNSSLDSSEVNPLLLLMFNIEDGAYSNEHNKQPGDRYLKYLPSDFYVSGYVTSRNLYNYNGYKWFEYMDDEEKKMYCYLFETQGLAAAEDYLEAKSDKFHNILGMKEAEAAIAKCVSNGDLSCTSLFVEGFFDGCDSWWDGTRQIFMPTNTYTVNEYKQMYVMQYITNSSGLYLSDLVQEMASVAGEEKAAEFAQNIYLSDGTINLEYAKVHMTSEDYNLLVQKVNNDNSVINQHAYRFGITSGQVATMVSVNLMAKAFTWYLPIPTELVAFGHTFGVSKNVATAMGFMLNSVSSIGNKIHHAYTSGSDLSTARVYGVISGFSETTLDYLFSNVPGLSQLSKMNGISILMSGLSEAAQTYLESYLDDMILGKYVNLDELHEEAKIAALYSMIISFGSNIPDAINQMNIYMNGKKMTYNDMISYLDGNVNLSNITDPTIILNAIEDGTITKARIKSELVGLVGENLGDWVLTDDAATSLYVNLLTSCNDAGIKLSDVKSCIDVLDSMSDFYTVARDGLANKLESGTGFFNTYRTHGIVHAFDVLTQSIDAYAAFKAIGINDLSLNTIMLSAVMHDTGMSGGKEICFFKNDQGVLVPQVNDVATPDGKVYRNSHSFNSGVNIIQGFEALRSAGYTDLEIAEAALLTFAHSKSNSGLNPLSSNDAGWSFAVQALAEATKDSGFDIVDVLIKNGKIRSGDTHFEPFTVPNPSGKKVGVIEVYDFDADWLKTAGYESLIIRIGDALTNNDNAGTNQYGKPITFETTDYNSQLGFAEIMAENGIDTSVPLDEQLEILLDRFKLGKDDPQKLSYLSLAEMEAANVTYEINGEKTNKSPQFVLGENNQTYYIRPVSNSGVEVVVSVKDSDAVPFCTIFAIDERAGELISKGDQLLSEVVDGKTIKLVIEIDSTTSESVKGLYQQYSEIAGIDVEIREVNS